MNENEKLIRAFVQGPREVSEKISVWDIISKVSHKEIRLLLSFLNSDNRLEVFRTVLILEHLWDPFGGPSIDRLMKLALENTGALQHACIQALIHHHKEIPLEKAQNLFLLTATKDCTIKNKAIELCSIFPFEVFSEIIPREICNLSRGEIEMIIGSHGGLDSKNLDLIVSGDIEKFAPIALIYLTNLARKGALKQEIISKISDSEHIALRRIVHLNKRNQRA